MNSFAWKSGWLFCFAFSLFLIWSPPVAHAQEAFDTGRYRIDITGKLRMLSQRISKSSCFISMGLDVESHAEMIIRDVHLFDDTLSVLRDGGGEHELSPETDRRALEKIDEISAIWAPIRELLEVAIQTNEVSYETVEYILLHDLALLNVSNEAVSLVEQEYANPNTLNMANAVTMNIYGRQRMLSQRAAKDFCFIVSGHHVAEEKADLEQTIAIFSASLDAITNGMPAAGIAPPPSDEILAQLVHVGEIWQPILDVFNRALVGGTPTDEEIAFIARENLHLLEEMDLAVQMFRNN